MFSTHSRRTILKNGINWLSSSIGEDVIFVNLAEEVYGKIKVKEFKEEIPSEGENIISSYFN